MTLTHANPPLSRPTAPDFELPEGAVDAHVHMLAGADFRLWEGRVEDPAPVGQLDDWLAVFEAHLSALGMARTVFVHSILYGGDNAVTLAATQRLGNRARAVCLLPDGAGDADIAPLAAAGCRAIRLNYVHGGLLSWDGARAMAPALHAAGLHLQMLAHADRHIAEIETDVRALPCPVVFDHCGWPADGLTTDTPGFQALLRLVADGVAYVKLSGIYRLARDWTETAPLVAALAQANPDRCLWGSDWPHIMLGEADQPDAGALLNAFADVVTDTDTRRRILVDNPARLFGF